MHIGKNHFNFISVWSEIMSLKSDRLELGFSIFGETSMLDIWKGIYYSLGREGGEGIVPERRQH